MLDLRKLVWHDFDRHYQLMLQGGYSMLRTEMRYYMH